MRDRLVCKGSISAVIWNIGQPSLRQDHIIALLIGFYWLVRPVCGVERKVPREVVDLSGVAVRDPRLLALSDTRLFSTLVNLP